MKTFWTPAAEAQMLNHRRRLRPRVMFLSVLTASTLCGTDDCRTKQSYIIIKVSWDKRSPDPQAGHETVGVNSLIPQMRTKQQAVEDTSGLGVGTVMEELNKANVEDGRRRGAWTFRWNNTRRIKTLGSRLGPSTLVTTECLTTTCSGKQKQKEKQNRKQN